MKRIYSVIGRTRRRWLTLAAALSLASAFLNVWVRIEVGELLDLLGTGTLQISSILANVFSFFLLILVMTFKPYLSAQYLIALKQNLYEAVSRQLMEMKLDTFTGSGAVNTFLSDIESICQAILRLLQKAIGDLGLFLFSIGALFLIHWSLPVIGIICSLLPAIALRLTNQPMKKAQEAYRKEEERANESLAFGLSNLESLKAFSLEERAARQAGRRELCPPAEGCAETVLSKRDFGGSVTAFCFCGDAGLDSLERLSDGSGYNDRGRAFYRAESDGLSGFAGNGAGKYGEAGASGQRRKQAAGCFSESGKGAGLFAQKRQTGHNSEYGKEQKGIHAGRQTSPGGLF